MSYIVKCHRTNDEQINYLRREKVTDLKERATVHKTAEQANRAMMKFIEVYASKTCTFYKFEVVEG